MKTMIKKYFTATLILLTVAFSSCEDFVKGTSEFDPTLPRDASLGQVINAAEVGLIGFVEGDLARLGGIFTGQFAGADRQYVSYTNYVVTAQDFDSQWANIYANVIKSLQIARDKATTLNNKRTVGLTKILEGYTIGMTAALFGDVPYSQAIKIDEFTNPAFQSQTEVYGEALRLLDEGIADITADVTAGVPTGYAGDIFGGGDAEWIARANTIRAKFLLHLKRYAEAAAAAGAGISSTDQDMLAPHGTSYGQDYNIYYSFLTYDRPGYMTADGAYAPALLDADNPLYRGNAKTDETGRFFWYYYPGGLNSNVEQYDVNVLSAGEQGFSWGVDPTGAENGFFAAEGSFPVVTYGENQLILAESLLRTGDAAGALTALNSWRQVLNTGYRVSAAWQGLGTEYEDYVLTDFAPGGLANTSGLGVNEALYQEIIEEKYVSLLGTLEVFNDMRRYGFGALAGEQNWEVIGITPYSGTNIPQRFLIPQTEINSNTSTPQDLPGLFEETEVFSQGNG